jgi:hypothetical protein
LSEANEAIRAIIRWQATTLLPAIHPNVESVGVVDLLAPGTASPCVTSIGVTLPVSTVLVCKVNSLGAAPKP